jgi:hypothetical protein
MEYKRVLATFAGGKEYEKDRNDKFIFLVTVNENNIIQDRQIFGYWVDDNDKYPFYSEIKKDKLIFNFGASDEDTYITNLLNKKIIIDELFTYTDEDSKEWTYRIESII